MLVNSLEVDIITLQELDVNTRRSGITLNQIEKFADRTRMYYKFGKTIDFDAGDYGIGILSRYPIVNSTFFPLPYTVESEEKRGLLVCTLDLGDGALLSVATTHLASQSNESRVSQANEIIKINNAVKIDLLTGDFNATQIERPIDILKKGFDFDSRFKEQLTIPTVKSSKKIDFIVKRKKAKLNIHRQAVFALNSLSDHNMMISDFKVLKESDSE